ncbi:Microtubule-associated protein 1A [Cucumispora dikerogammari]|nr:Microtubule-associated protein 1A [Cucumispora dikerogammari]
MKISFIYLYLLVAFFNLISVFSLNPIDNFIDSNVKIFSVNTDKFLTFDLKDFTNKPQFKYTINEKKNNSSFLLKKYNEKYTLKIFNLYFCIDGLTKHPCYLMIDYTKFGFHISNEKAISEKIEAKNEKFEPKNEKLEAKNKKFEEKNKVFEAKNKKFEEKNKKLEEKNKVFEAKNDDFEAASKENEKNKKCLNLALDGKCDENFDLNFLFDFKFDKKMNECDADPEKHIKKEDIENIEDEIKEYPELENKPKAKKWFKALKKESKISKIKSPLFQFPKGPGFSWPNFFC